LFDFLEVEYMSVFVYQTFELKQDKFKEGIENLQEIKKYRNENYNHKVEILTPITGRDHSYALLSTYEGLAEMELQNKKMFEDEEYTKLIGEFFLEAIVQGSMNTQLYRTMSEKKDKDKDKKKD
jgi:hypothetical protein